SSHSTTMGAETRRRGSNFVHGRLLSDHADLLRLLRRLSNAERANLRQPRHRAHRFHQESARCGTSYRRGRIGLGIPPCLVSPPPGGFPARTARNKPRRSGLMRVMMRTLLMPLLALAAALPIAAPTFAAKSATDQPQEQRSMATYLLQQLNEREQDAYKRYE